MKRIPRRNLPFFLFGEIRENEVLVSFTICGFFRVSKDDLHNCIPESHRASSKISSSCVYVDLPKNGKSKKVKVKRRKFVGAESYD